MIKQITIADKLAYKDILKIKKNRIIPKKFINNDQELYKVEFDNRTIWITKPQLLKFVDSLLISEFDITLSNKIKSIYPLKPFFVLLFSIARYDNFITDFVKQHNSPPTMKELLTHIRKTL